MKIAVIAGGLSPERDVSLSSGALIAAALVRCGHRVAFADLFFGIELPEDPDSLFCTQSEQRIDIPECAPDLDSVRASRKNGDPRAQIGDGIPELCRAADLVFLALHGGAGENGQFQAMLDLYGIPYTGSGYAGALLAMNKVLSKHMMCANGIRTPEWVSFTPAQIKGPVACAQTVLREIGIPCVVKPASNGSSIGVSLVDTEEQLLPALEALSAFGDSVLAERKIIGREFSVGVLGNESLPAIEIIPLCGFYDYKNKYQPGMTKEVCPAQITAEQSQTMGNAALAVHHALGLGSYSRVDFLLEESTGLFYALEANTLPGMTPSSLLPQEAQAAGIPYDVLCDKIAHAALKR